MLFHHQSKEEVAKHFETDSKSGLSSKEVAKRQEKYGPNKLREKKKKTNFQRFMDQFKDVMILILIAAAVVSFVLICIEGNWGELFEPGLILLIVIINAIMGVMQESKAEKALDALKKRFDQIVLEESPYVYRDSIFDILKNFVAWTEKFPINVIFNLHKESPK